MPRSKNEPAPLFLEECYLRVQKTEKRKDQSTQQTKKTIIRMISTIQWSLFITPYPMPVCFAERWGR